MLPNDDDTKRNNNVEFPIHIRLTDNFYDQESLSSSSYLNQIQLLVKALHVATDKITTCYRIDSLSSQQCLSSLQVTQDIAASRRASCDPKFQKGEMLLRHMKHGDPNSKKCLEGMNVTSNEETFAGRLEFDSNPDEMFSAVYSFVIETTLGFYVTRIEVRSSNTFF